MASWQTPKTDWNGDSADGTYTGDYFNATDFNRIKNNLNYLREIAVKIYADFEITEMSPDKSFADYAYADEFNVIEDNLETVNTKTLKKSYGATKHFVENGLFIDATELNRIEKAEQDLCEHFMNQLYGRRTFTMNFGINNSSI